MRLSQQILFFVCCLVNITASCLDVPQLTARVNDYAGMLRAETKINLEKKLSALEQTDSTQIVILTVNSLNGEPIEQAAIKVANAWKLGQKSQNNGVLVLISKLDRKVRIEVGYGLEGRLTDACSGRIIDEIIVPNFKQGDFNQGVELAVDKLISVVKGEFVYSKEGFLEQNKYLYLVMLAFWALFIFYHLKKLKRGITDPIIASILGSLIVPHHNLVDGIVTFAFSFFLGAILGAMLGKAYVNNSRIYGGGDGGNSGGFGGGSFGGGGGSFGGGGSSGRW